MTIKVNFVDITAEQVVDIIENAVKIVSDSDPFFEGQMAMALLVAGLISQDDYVKYVDP